MAQPTKIIVAMISAASSFDFCGPLAASVPFLKRRSFIVDDDAFAFQRHALQVLRPGPTQSNNGGLIVAHAILAFFAKVHLLMEFD